MLHKFVILEGVMMLALAVIIGTIAMNVLGLIIYIMSSRNGVSEELAREFMKEVDLRQN